MINKKYITEIYLMKNQFKFSTLTNISNNYSLSYYVKNEELYKPWINLMMSFAPRDYLKHYQNVSYKVNYSLNINMSL